MEVFTWDNFTPSFHFLPTVQSFSQELITETVNHVVEFTLKDKITYLEKLFSEWKISTVKDVEKTMFQKFNNISNLEKCSEFKQFVISQVQTQLTNWNMVWNEVQKEINLFSSKQKEDMIRSDSKISNIRNEINNLKNEYSKVYNKNIHSKSDLEAIKDELEKLSFKIDKQEKDMISKNFDHKKDFNTLQQEISKITQKISHFDTQFTQVDKLVSDIRVIQAKMDDMKTKIQTFTDFNGTLDELSSVKLDVMKIQKDIDYLQSIVQKIPTENNSNQILEIKSSIGLLKNDSLKTDSTIKELKTELASKNEELNKKINELKTQSLAKNDIFTKQLLELKSSVSVLNNDKLNKQFGEILISFSALKAETASKNQSLTKQLTDLTNALSQFKNELSNKTSSDFSNHLSDLKSGSLSVTKQLNDLKLNSDRQLNELINQVNDLKTKSVSVDEVSKQFANINSKIESIKQEQSKQNDKIENQSQNLEGVVEKFTLDFNTLKDQLKNLNECFTQEISSLDKMIENKIKMHIELVKQDLIQFDENESKMEEWKKLFEKNQFENWKRFRQEFSDKNDEFNSELKRNSQLLLDFNDELEVNNEKFTLWKKEIEENFTSKWVKCQDTISTYITDIDKKLNSFENRISTLEQMCDDLRKDVINQEFKFNDSNYLRFVDGSIYIGDVELSDKNNLVTRIANIYSNNVPVVDSPMMVMCDNKGQLGTNFSSIVYKENVDNIGEISRIIYKLRPVSFTYKTDENKNLQYGLIGEEVEKVSPELVCYNKEDNIIGVAYHKLIPLMINEMKLLKKELDTLKLKMN